MGARSYDVIVIGAGIIGLSVAYYLKKQKCRKVLVLEKEDSWITGSTARANGGFRQQFSTPINIRLSQISLPVFKHFEEEFRTDIAFRQRGYLFLTATGEGDLALHRNLRIQQSHGVPVEWVTAEDLLEMVPFVEAENLRGGTFCPEDGYADSYSIAEGFGQRARQLGAEIEMGHPVVEIQTASGQVTGVRTPRETIQTGRLINATGPYAAVTGQMAGIEIPAQPVRRMLLMSEDFPEISEEIPMVIDADSGVVLRQESGKILMSWSDPEEPPGFNLEFDPSFVEVLAEKTADRFPLLQQVRINPRRSWAGLYSVTPDHHCILGEAPNLPGFFLANGFSGHGMMHAPAVGMIISDLVLEGTTRLVDPHPLRLSRFEEGDLVEETVVL